MFTNYGRSYGGNYGASYGGNYGGNYAGNYGGYGRTPNYSRYRDFASSRFGGYGNWGGQNYYQMGQNKRFAVDQNYAQMELMKQQNALMQRLIDEREKAVDKTNESLFSLNKVGNYIKGFWTKIGENPQIGKVIHNVSTKVLNSYAPGLGTAVDFAGGFLAESFKDNKTIQSLFGNNSAANDPLQNPYLAGYNKIEAAYEKGRNYYLEQQKKAAQEKMLQEKMLQQSQQQNFSFAPQSFNYGAPSPGSSQQYYNYQPPSVQNTYFYQLPSKVYNPQKNVSQGRRDTLLKKKVSGSQPKYGFRTKFNNSSKYDQRNKQMVLYPGYAIENDMPE